jgi:TRAP-type C4-dicarboxylate transport system substrate-binding protein
MSSRVKPIRSIEDVQGLKMRVPGGPVAAKVWKAFGTLPVSLPWTELYTALQTGVVDACESTIPGFTSAKLYEVSKYLGKTEHEFMVSVFLMSQKTYAKLPADLQALVRRTVEESAVISTKEGVDQTLSMLEDLRKRGLTITDVDKSGFMSRSVAIQDEEAGKLNLTDVLGQIRAQAKSF